MIKINNQDVRAIYKNDIAITAVYINNERIWPNDIINAGDSCYANGYWIDEYPWTDDTPWAA